MRSLLLVPLPPSSRLSQVLGPRTFPFFLSFFHFLLLLEDPQRLGCNTQRCPNAISLARLVSHIFRVICSSSCLFIPLVFMLWQPVNKPFSSFSSLLVDREGVLERTGKETFDPWKSCPPFCRGSFQTCGAMLPHTSFLRLFSSS